MATHSNVLTWEILWTEEPVGLQSEGLQTFVHDLVTEHGCMFSWGDTIRATKRK